MTSILDKPVVVEKQIKEVVPKSQEIPVINPKSATGSKRKDLFKGIK